VSSAELLPHYQAKTLRQGGQKFLIDAQGVRLPSVTTILNATKPAADRLALQQWRDRVGHSEASRIATTASRRGSQTHKYLKEHLLGKQAPCPEGVQPYWDSLTPVLTNVAEVRLVEGFVFHYDLRYAGRVDCIASYHGIPCICDWKTADRPKGSLDRLHDAPLQLAAYCGAVNHTYAEQGIKLNHAAVIVAIAHQPAEVFWLDTDVLRNYWQQWQTRVDQFYRRWG
jgi:genome maintenance exonuclease 1